MIISLVGWFTNQLITREQYLIKGFTTHIYVYIYTYRYICGLLDMTGFKDTYFDIFPQYLDLSAIIIIYICMYDVTCLLFTLGQAKIDVENLWALNHLLLRFADA